MSQIDREYEERVRTVVGDDRLDRDEVLRRWHIHLESELTLPCDLTGIEDFRWEEFYVLGPGSREEYDTLRRDRPSYTDVFELKSVGRGEYSEWSLSNEDLTAHVRRKSDGKEFVLGLSELKAVKRNARNSQLLNDFSVWFVNSGQRCRRLGKPEAHPDRPPRSYRVHFGVRCP